MQSSTEADQQPQGVLFYMLDMVKIQFQQSPFVDSNTHYYWTISTLENSELLMDVRQVTNAMTLTTNIGAVISNMRGIYPQYGEV